MREQQEQQSITEFPSQRMRRAGPWVVVAGPYGEDFCVHEELVALIQRAVVALERIAEESGEVLTGRHRELTEHVRRCQERLAGMPGNGRYRAEMGKAMAALARFEADHPWLARPAEGEGDAAELV